MTHRWSGWPGAWCLDCGVEDPRELECAGLKIPTSHPGFEPCKEPGSKRHDPYAQAEKQKNLDQQNQVSKD